LNNFAYTKKTNISLASKSGLHEKSWGEKILAIPSL
jgi:hypothetical protein